MCSDVNVDDGASSRRGWPILRALRGRNYTLFFSGQAVSLMGTWIQSTALGWLVYDQLTDSKFKLGLVGFVGQILTVLVAPLAGVFTDRWNRHRVLLATQILLMVQASVLAGLTLSGAISYNHVLVLAMFAGLVTAVDIPNRQSFMVDIVHSREDLPHAIALNSFAFNGARLLGPVVAGVLIKAAGEGTCFLINAVSFLAVIGTVLAMRVPPPMPRPRKHPGRELLEGMRYCFGFAPIRAPLVLLACMGLIGMSYATLIPVFARDILAGQYGLDGEYVQGLLIASAGLGAICGALYLGSRRSLLGLDRVVGIAPLLLGAGLICLGLSPWLGLSLPLLVVIGAGQMVQMAGTNTILQSIVDDDKRGRVMGFYAISFLGTAPLGALLYGSMAQVLGAPWALAIGGTGCMAASLIYQTQLPRIRRQAEPIYRRLLKD